MLAALPMQAIVFAFTTTSYVLGPNGERALKNRLEKHSNGIPILLTGPAAIAAFRKLGARRIALFHPPWFADDEEQCPKAQLVRLIRSVRARSRRYPARVRNAGELRL